jgi:SOUL heme-binding protein
MPCYSRIIWKAPPRFSPHVFLDSANRRAPIGNPIEFGRRIRFIVEFGLIKLLANTRWCGLFGHRRIMKTSKLYWILLSLVVMTVVAVAAAGPVMSNVEQPKYTTLFAAGSNEIREYAPVIAAEVNVTGDRSAAIQTGFRTIAAYIFGANKPHAKIAMTAPVEQQSQKIAMTAPVTQQSNGRDWIVRFIMPASWTIETLPEPSDPRVKLVPIPERRMAVIRFSGWATDSLIASKTAELRAFVSQRKLDAVGEPVLAFYNPPWTLPFLRRNEVMLEVASQS